MDLGWAVLCCAGAGEGVSIPTINWIQGAGLGLGLYVSTAICAAAAAAYMIVVMCFLPTYTDLACSISSLLFFFFRSRFLVVLCCSKLGMI